MVGEGGVIKIAVVDGRKIVDAFCAVGKDSNYSSLDGGNVERGCLGELTVACHYASG